MTNYLPRLAERVLGRPLLLTPDKAAVVLDVLAGRIGIEACTGAIDANEANRFVGAPDAAGFSYRIKDGAAILTIAGSLVNRGAWLGAQSGLVSYEGIAAQLHQALADDEVDRIVLDFDSPGGEAGGVARLAAEIRAANRQKPVTALINDMAASAAYWLAAAAGRILISPTSVVGSIGVIWAHVDASGALEQAGKKITLIQAGAHKADGNPYGPLPEEARARIQDEINALYAVFVGDVARYRGIDEAAIRATEASTFTGHAAIEVGLADGIGGLDEALAENEFERATTAPAVRSKGEASMSKKAVAPDVAPKNTQETHPDADDLTAREAAAIGAAAREAEAERIKAILTSPEATGREELAQELAFGLRLEADAAVKLLAAAPRAEKATSHMAAAIAQAGMANAVEGEVATEVAATSAPRIDPAAIYARRRNQ